MKRIRGGAFSGTSSDEGASDANSRTAHFWQNGRSSPAPSDQNLQPAAFASASRIVAGQFEQVSRSTVATPTGAV